MTRCLCTSAQALLAFSVIVRITSFATNAATTADGDDKDVVDLTILHTGDLHGRFGEMSATYNECSAADALAGRCFGGFGRLVHSVREYRKKSKPVLVLDAGDTYTGTVWFAINRDRIVTEFMNLLAPDAVCPGNHEFDYGINGLVPYIRAASFPFVCANVNASGEPSLAQVGTLRSSTVVTVKGRSIGIIGYLTPDTMRLSRPNNLSITDEVEAINAEATRLRFGGARTIIALGHSGLNTDRRIAASCPLVDLVIGGHSNHFMWNGPPPSTETPSSGYPLVIEQPGSGKRVPIVHAYAYGKYLGHLNVSIAPNGSLVAFDGQPLLLDASVPQDPQALRLLDTYRDSVELYRGQSVGRTAVPLDSESRSEETAAGNLVCDALVHAHVTAYNATVVRWPKGVNGSQSRWIDGALAFYNSGGIKPIDGAVRELSMSDLLTMLPYDSLFASVWLRGDEIRQLLEQAVATYSTEKEHRGMVLQMSGARVVYDVRRPAGERVREVQVLCAECEVPRYEKLRSDGDYLVLVPDMLRLGGDGFGMLVGREYEMDPDGVVGAVRKYVKERRVVYPVLEGRIRFVGGDGEDGDESNLSTSGANVVLGSVWMAMAAAFILYY